MTHRRYNRPRRWKSALQDIPCTFYFAKEVQDIQGLLFSKERRYVFTSFSFKSYQSLHSLWFTVCSMGISPESVLTLSTHWLSKSTFVEDVGRFKARSVGCCGSTVNLYTRCIFFSIFSDQVWVSLKVNRLT
ncbi:unnamed protein product [Rhizopus stolonifer]